MKNPIITHNTLKGKIPPPFPEDPFPRIQREVAQSPIKLVILDDDPTGTQTVHGMPVLTSWSEEVLAHELRAPGPGFFILTNSRSLTPRAAAELSQEIGANLSRAISTTGSPVEIISRSDSTLRGHFPGEVDALMAAMGTPERPRILIPFFLEGGRLTANDIHYVAEGDQLVPAAQTPYARDTVFGYQNSNLKDWVVERTGGNLGYRQVSSVTLEDIRLGGEEAVAERLAGLAAGDCCVVNAMEYRDLVVFVAGLLRAQSRGNGPFVYRTAASYVRVRAGIVPRNLLSREDLTVDNRHGGLFVVGSYVPKTTAQLAALKVREGVVNVEVRVRDLLDGAKQGEVITEAGNVANEALGRGQDVVLFTSRNLITAKDDQGNLDIGRRVSDSLIAMVHAIHCQPRYLVAKGGITSSDMATLGLGVKRAMVMGQVLPGVPVWKLGDETRWPGMAYIAFPGNVGEDDALATIQRRLSASHPRGE